MRAMVIGRYGPLEVFKVRESPEPTLKSGEALVRVHAVGVGFADLMQRMGIYPGTPKPPFIPGLEVAGVVERVSTGSPDDRPSRSASASRRSPSSPVTPSESLCQRNASFASQRKFPSKRLRQCR
jgi:NADPH:quinone reductase-like Zn-dependent oxidoreductase